MTVRHNPADDPSAPEISVRDILVAWGLLGLIAGYVLITEPPCPRAGPPSASALEAASRAAGPRAPVDAPDGFENDADRAAALAGLQDDPTVDVPQRSQSVDRLSSDRLQTCERAQGLRSDHG